MYLVDTNVLSAGAPGRRERQAAGVEWMDAHSQDLFLSAITVAEIRDSKSGSDKHAADRGPGASRRLRCAKVPAKLALRCPAMTGCAVITGSGIVDARMSY